MLTLLEKVNIIKELEFDLQDLIAERHGVSQQCISYISRNKEKIVNYINSDEFERKWKGKGRSRGKSKQLRLPKDNELRQLANEVYKFCREILDLGVPLFNSMIRSKALFIGQNMRMNQFKASTTWSTNFIKKHNLRYRLISGESRSVDVDKVDYFRGGLIDELIGYNEDDIYNADESSFFWRSNIRRSYIEKKEDAFGFKDCRMRIIVLFFLVSRSGKNEKLLDIGKAKRPH